MSTIPMLSTGISLRAATLAQTLPELKLTAHRAQMETLQKLVMGGLALLEKTTVDETTHNDITTGASIFLSALKTLEDEASKKWNDRHSEIELDRFVSDLYSAIMTGKEFSLSQSLRCNSNRFFQGLQALKTLAEIQGVVGVEIIPSALKDAATKPVPKPANITFGDDGPFTIYSIEDLELCLYGLPSDNKRFEALESLLTLDWYAGTQDGEPDTTALAAPAFQAAVCDLLFELSRKLERFPDFNFRWDKIKKWSDSIPDRKYRVLFLKHIAAGYRNRGAGFTGRAVFQLTQDSLNHQLATVESELASQEAWLDYQKPTHSKPNLSPHTPRYQVFVSSTYEDLKEERRDVIETLLRMDCFPAAMEWFSGSNVDKWDVIAPVIEESDYFLVIIAGRYGSGFAEREYDYAMKLGIPIIAFVRDQATILVSRTDQDNEQENKLAAFREKVMHGMVVQWSDKAALAALTSTTLHSVIKRDPQTGWVRGVGKASKP